MATSAKGSAAGYIVGGGPVIVAAKALDMIACSTTPREDPGDLVDIQLAADTSCPAGAKR